MRQKICLQKGEIIQLGNTLLAVLHVPDHSPGHIALYSQQAKVGLSGDVLFQGSIGRMDLPSRDHALLLQNIHQQLFLLGDEVVIYAGHGLCHNDRRGEKKQSFLQTLVYMF